MPEWLSSPSVINAADWSMISIRLGEAILCGLLVATSYVLTQRRTNGQVASLSTTLVLLTILVAMTTIVIGDSVARAFGLVGALSIVRFRTVVDDTRDTSFVIFAVVVGMAIGAGYLAICVLGIPAVALVAYGLSLATSNGSATVHQLEVRIAAGQNVESNVTRVLDEQFPGWKLVSLGSAKQGASLDFVYRVTLRDSSKMLSSVKMLCGIEGVQSVDLKGV